MSDIIEIGDRVNVFFPTANAEFDVEVLYGPQDVGDSWKMKRADGTPINVQLFSKMERIKKGGDE